MKLFNVMLEGERVDTCVLTHAAHQNCDLQLRGVYVFVYVYVCMYVCVCGGGGGRGGGYMCAYFFVRFCA
jgi:hypothetical protein